MNCNTQKNLPPQPSSPEFSQKTIGGSTAKPMLCRAFTCGRLLSARDLMQKCTFIQMYICTNDHALKNMCVRIPLVNDDAKKEERYKWPSVSLIVKTSSRMDPLIVFCENSGDDVSDPKIME